MSIWDLFRRSVVVEGDGAGPNVVTPLVLQAAGVRGTHAERVTIEWDAGWWRGAKRTPIHPGRVGGRIDPWGVVLHTTDMHPATFGALVKRCQAEPGAGAGWHFLVGRTPEEGVHQMTPITRNGQHAGGPGGVHGWYQVEGRRVHPNLVTVGIEVHSAGPLRRADGKWRYGTRKDGVWQPQGAPIDDSEVVGVIGDRGWHAATLYQRHAVADLLRSLDKILRPVPADVKVAPNGKPEPWASARTIRVLGHCSLDPARKTDPGPEWMRTL